jgi:sugar phosphate isomerase/epimerase
MNPELGLQLWSVRESLQQDAVGVIEKIAEIGYKHLQPAVHGVGTDDVEHVAGSLNASELKRLADRLGLGVQSIHVRVSDETDWDRMISLNQELGSSAIIVPIAWFTDRASTVEYAHALNRYGEVCRKHGIDFYYHNHFHEFQVMGGQTVMDLLLANTDPVLVKFEFDTYWAARGGADPVEWLLKLGNRCDLTHQKDLPSSAKPVNLFDVFGKDARITLQELIQTLNTDQFAEIGEGTMDLKGLIGTMRRIGVKYVFVEQDMTAMDEIESVRISYQNIVPLLKQAE